jgi:nicotinamide riboside transporter PnuC
MLHLDYISCLLTILSTILIGKRLWHGWIIAAINSLVVCVIGVQTAQYGFLPGNLFCIALYAHNLSAWRPENHKDAEQTSSVRETPDPIEQSVS